MQVAYFFSESYIEEDTKSFDYGVRSPYIMKHPAVRRWGTGKRDKTSHLIYFLRVYTADIIGMNQLKADISGNWEWVADA